VAVKSDDSMDGAEKETLGNSTQTAKEENPKVEKIANLSKKCVV